MLLVVDKPAIQYVVEEGLASGADEVIIINSRDKKSIEAHFTPDPDLEAELRSRGKDSLADKVAHAGSLNVSYVYQDEPLGLGHAVHCAADKIEGEPFFVLLGDVLVPENNMLTRMKEISDEHNGANVIAVLPVPETQVDRFGVIAGEKSQAMSGRFQHSAKSRPPKRHRAILRYSVAIFLSPRVMELLAEVKPGAGGEIQLTDALDEVLKEEEMYALIINEEDGFDTGTVESWLDTNNRLFARLKNA